MRSTATRIQVLKQLDTVSQQLASPKISGSQRMTLLRRQAELGDLRDALSDRARRTAIAAAAAQH